MSVIKKLFKKTETLIKIPFEDNDYSVFNCVGLNHEFQFMAFITGASPWNTDTNSTYFNPNNTDWTKKKRWYGVLHLFDMKGNHKQTVTFLGGMEADGREEACDRAFHDLNQTLLEMGELKFSEIVIKPFEYMEGDYMFGLVLEKNKESATLWPNDIIFSEPWDGQYST